MQSHDAVILYRNFDLILDILPVTTSNLLDYSGNRLKHYFSFLPRMYEFI